MYELVLKDFRLNKMIYLINALWLPVYAGMLLAIGYPEGMKVLPAVGIFLAVGNLFSLDEKGHSNMLFASLPYGRRSLVKARYISVWLIFIAVTLFFFGLEMVFGAWQPVYSKVIDQLPMELVEFSVVSLLMMIIALPFMFRYGVGGFFIGISVFLMFFVLLDAISDSVNVFTILRQSLNPMSWSVTMKAGMKIAITLFVLWTMTSISYLISARIFKKKDLG
jgi:ABC-2 type transport system permease protein